MPNKELKPKEGLAKAIDFAAIFDNMTQPMTIAAAEKPNPLIYVNDAYCQLTGYSREELIGKNPGFLQGPNYSKQRELIRDGMNSDKPIDVLVLNYKHDGSEFWNELHIHSVLIDGERAFYVGMARDVTERVTKNIESINTTISIIQEFKERLKDSVY